MKLTKNTLIEGEIVKKGTELRFKEAKKLTKSQIELLDFIKHQINIDLYPFVDVSRSSTKYITVYTDEFGYNDERLVESLGFSSGRYRIEPNGSKAIAIIKI